MSHEIRTPLNAIVGLSDLMQMDKNAISEDNIKILNFSSKNLHALITGILDLTKIDAGKIELIKIILIYMHYWKVSGYHSRPHVMIRILTYV